MSHFYFLFLEYCWLLLYCLDDNKPFFCDVDKQVTSTSVRPFFCDVDKQVTSTSVRP